MSRKFSIRNQKVEISRRQALRVMGSCAITAAAFDPVKSLISGLVDGAMLKAQAASVGDSKGPRNYMYIALPGGPNRFHFDLPLAPYSELNNANYTYPTASMNPGIATRFSGTSSVTPIYGTTVVTAPNSGVRLRMPHMWGWTIPTTGGTWIPMTSILDNMGFIRGIQSLDGHTDSQGMQIRPTAGSPSIDGAVADKSSRPVPAVALAGSVGNSFGSATGIGNLRVEEIGVDQNPLRAILTPFDRTSDGLSNTYLSRRQAMSVAMEQAMTALKNAASAQTAGADSLWANRKTAEDMIRTGIGDVSQVYSTIQYKYATLVSLCANEHALGRAPGITDRDLSKSRFSDPDIYKFDGGESRDNNVGNIFSFEAGRPDRCTGLSGIAESFAIAEYLFVNGYSSSIIAGVGGPRNLEASAGFGWDEHGNGTIGSMLVLSFVYRAVAACMYEFSKTLKAANIWDETVIHMGAEFARSPRADMKGYDHSPDGACISIFSGAIKAPFVLGNTRPADDTMHPGNYGIGDLMNLDGGQRQPTVGNQASTLCAMLRVTSPKPNDASMLVETANGIVPAVDTAKQRGES